ncbi:hypothetical protein [Aquimarina sp. 2201CG14-23]|uniref:hypothetical protein n=1 Tax=Aquimarina mycalae TaxID=3040073 RepID=UPI002477DAD7|nr:hypothetical protein [Aquimarina sp. 2201CG14-23]MDH7447036.1 hypothetical protein [Aquimarina sp. 2201CG14-23]
MDLTTSCKRIAIKNILLAIVVTLGTVTISFSQNQKELEETIRDSINIEFTKNYSNCSSYTKNGITNFNGKTEFWKICELKNGNRILQIESHSKSTYFQEIYFEKNGKLIYAKETENYVPMNSFEQMQWNCEFYIKDNNVITFTSLGRGKTENEDWNKNTIIRTYATRVSEIEKIQQ